MRRASRRRSPRLARCSTGSPSGLPTSAAFRDRNCGLGPRSSVATAASFTSAGARGARARCRTTRGRRSRTKRWRLSSAASARMRFAGRSASTAPRCGKAVTRCFAPTATLVRAYSKRRRACAISSICASRSRTKPIACSGSARRGTDSFIRRLSATPPRGKLSTRRSCASTRGGASTRRLRRSARRSIRSEAPDARTSPIERASAGCAG